MDGCLYPDVCPAVAGSPADGSVSQSCPMSMFFTHSSDVCVLLQAWRVHSLVQWLLLAVAVLAVAVCRELLIAHRQHRARQRRAEQVEAKRRLVLQADVRSHPTKAQPSTSSSASSSSSSSTALAMGGLSSPLMDDERRPWPHDALGSASTSASASSSAPLSLWSTLLWSDVWVSLCDGVSYALSLLLAYVLMLLVMTYNVALIGLVVLASSAAHVCVCLAFTALWRREVEERGRQAEAEALDTAGSAEAGGRLPVSTALLLVQQSSEALKAASDPCCNDLDME